MKPITFKQVLDSEGFLTALELWQGNNFITITLSQKDTHRNGFRWDEVREVVDRLAARARQDVLAGTK